MSKQLMVIPKNMSLKTVTIDGKTRTVLQEKKRRRRRRGPTRAAARRAARRFKVPILTTAAVGLPLASAYTAVGGIRNIHSLKNFFRHILSYYTGVWVPETGDPSFKWSKMMVGWLPAVAITIASRFGVFKRINQKLTRAKIPAGLN